MKPILTLLLTLFASCTLAAEPPRKPNVIVILTDDQGYADAGFQGFPASRQALTPNLDRLAREGIVFRNGYVAFSTCGNRLSARGGTLKRATTRRTKRGIEAGIHPAVR